MIKKNTPHQQELQFVDLTQVDGRNLVREISISRAERLHVISIDNIRLRPGKRNKYFNWRIQPEGMSDEDYEIRLGIPELADAIYQSNGPDDAPRGDVKDGLFYINGGERRFRALRYLIEVKKLKCYPNGKQIDQVEVLLNPKDFTDSDRRRIIHSSDNNLRYTTLERAYGYLEMKEEDGLTNEQIADNLHISRQTVDNYLLLTELPAEVQEKIDKGEINITAALAEYRAGKKKAKSGKAIIDEETGENLGILTEAQERHLAEKAKEDEKLRGDEDEFEQQDNSITGPGSMGGPKQEGSGAVVVGKDSIYMHQQQLATWKQLVNRFRVIEQTLLEDNPHNLLNIDDLLAERLKNEYNLTVK